MPEFSRRRRRPGLPSLGVLALLLVVGCRFSGSATDPFAESPLTDAAGGSGGTSGAGGTSDNGGAADTGGTSDNATNTGGTDIGATEGSPGNDAAAGAAGATGPEAGLGGPPPSPDECQPATPPAICDPVKNQGCLVPFSFCDIDPAQVVATGRCVFPWTSNPPLPPPDGGSNCLVDATTDTCVATSTCVQGSCRKLCYCDSDCPAGECCTEPAPGSSSVFKLCKSC